MNDSQKNPWMISTLVLIGLIAGYGIGQVPALRISGQASVIKATDPLPSAADVPQLEEEKPVVLTEEQIKKLPDDDAVIGNKDAPITVVEFSDFQCPFCEKFWRESFGLIRDNYIASGKVKFIYRDFPLDFHPQAAPAALAAECAGDQGKFEKMHDILFEKQTEWSGSTAVGELFKKYANKIGLNSADFNSCYDGKKAEFEIRQDLIDGVALGITGTPGFFINGKALSGAMPYEEVFKPIFEAELVGKKWELKYNLQTRRPYIDVTE